MPRKKIKSKFKISLVFLAIFLTAILLMTWFFIRLINSTKEKIKTDLEIEMARIERGFTDKIDHTFFTIKNINSQIAQDPKNKKHIDEVLSAYRSNSTLTNSFSWTVFGWLDDDYKIIVNSREGIMKNPIDLSVSNHIPFTEKQPDVLKLGSPVIGGISKKWIIPGGVGLIDKNGKYLGTTTIGFEIEILAKLLNKVLQNPEIDFKLYSRNGVPIFHGNCKIYGVDKSSDEAINNTQVSKILNQINSSTKDKIFDISLFQNRHAILIKKIADYPYIMILTYDEKAIKKEFFYIASSRLIEIFSIIFVLLILLILIYRERQQTRKILELKQSANQANDLKSEFLNKATHEFKNFVFGIQGCAEIIKNDLHQMVKNHKAGAGFGGKNHLHDLEIDLDLSRDIIEASHDLDNFLNDLTDLTHTKDGEFKINKNSKLTDVKKIIKRATSLLAKRAKTSDIILITKVADDLHLLSNLDPHRIKQVIMNLVSSAIKYSPNGSVVEITARNIEQKDELRKINQIRHGKKFKAIEIIVKDQGFGMNEDEINAALKTIKSLKKSETLSLDLPIVKYLIEKQGGILEIKSQKNHGTEIKIIL